MGHWRQYSVWQLWGSDDEWGRVVVDEDASNLLLDDDSVEIEIFSLEYYSTVPLHYQNYGS
jgi:hypothetical protein